MHRLDGLDRNEDEPSSQVTFQQDMNDWESSDPRMRSSSLDFHPQNLAQTSASVQTTRAGLRLMVRCALAVREMGTQQCIAQIGWEEEEGSKSAPAASRSPFSVA